MNRFVCTPAGAVAAGRRRLRAILLGPAIVTLIATPFVWARGSIFPGILCLGGALVLYSIWRMANRHEPQHLDVDDGLLRVRLRWQLFDVDLTGATARLLTGEEREHVERLTSIGGMVSTSGGYDSRLLGEFDLYASNLDNALLLETEEARFVLTPDDPTGFVDTVGRLRVP